MTGNGLKDTLQSAVQLNKEHQYALNVYTERLEIELEAVDKLLTAAEVEEEDSHLDIAGCIQVAGASKPVGLLSSTELLSQDLPFYDDATRRQRFLSFTEYHPMKPKEAECLADAVRLENRRLHAYEAQRRGEHSFTSELSMEDLESTEGLDWERIATKVNNDSFTISQRSATECKIHWLGDRHPRFNHSPWPASEIETAKALVEGREGSEIDWVSIARQLGTRRTPIDVMRHTIARRTHVWDAESDRRLVEAVKKYGTESWSLVARTVSEDAQINSCQNRWYRTLDPSIRRGNWSPEEDTQLRLAVGLYGHAWMEVASFIPGRTNEQCRDRWTERLNPKIPRGKWTSEEDARLLSAVDEFGLGKWKEVSEKVGTGRTDSTCRYRYDALKGQGNSDIACDASEAQMVVPVTKEASSSKPRQRKRKGAEDASRESQTQTSSGNKRPGTQEEREPGNETETMERGAVQPDVDPRPLPAGNSKNVRPRARPLKRAKSPAHSASDSPPQPHSTGQIQPAASGVAAVGAVEPVHASPPTQGVESEGSHEDILRLPQKRPNSTSRKLNHADKRQKVSDQVQSEEVAETMDGSADVDAAAKAPGAESSLSDNIDIDPALGGQVKEGPRPPVVQSVANVHATPKKSQPIRVKKATAPTRIQPKRSSRS